MARRHRVFVCAVSMTYEIKTQSHWLKARSQIQSMPPFITAFCRGVLGEIMNALPRDVAIFNVTTDGFLTTATAEQMAQASTGTLCKFYRSSRRLLTGVPSGKEDVYEIKHIIRKPLGWRTRAQATLVPSEMFRLARHGHDAKGRRAICSCQGRHQTT